MMYQNLALVGLSMCLTYSVEGFSVGSAAFARPTTFTSTASSTCLFAKDEETAEPVEESTAAGDDSSGTDILNSPAFLQRKLDVLKSDIAKVEEDIAAAKVAVEEGKEEWGQQFDGLEAEFKNIQNRFSKQGQKGDEEATMNVARKMLEVIDNYNRAFGAVTAETDEEKEIEAKYKASYESILSTFEDLGVKEIATLGVEFDYEVHQAVMQRPHEDYEEGIVCDELQKGYMLDSGRLIRAAMVSVAA